MHWIRNTRARTIIGGVLCLDCDLNQNTIKLVK